jgi:hypothetical protein
MSPRSLAICGLTLLTGLAGCRDGGPLGTSLTPGAAGHALLDGSAPGGNPSFYFLPPIAPRPDSKDAVNLDLRPMVEVCRLDGAACGPVLATFRTGSGSPMISVVDEHYQVDWKTDTSLRSGDLARITVYVRDRRDNEAGNPPVLGYADVTFDTRGGATLRPGQMLPIRFRIEQGAVSWAVAVAAGREPQPCNDCVEQVVTSDQEATVVTPAGHAGAYLPAGAIPAEYEEVIFTINRINPLSSAGPCFPATVPGEDPLAVPLQAEGCFEYNTEPRLEPGFGVPVQITQCLDPTKNLGRYGLFKYSPHREDKLSALPPTQYGPSTYVTSATCESFQNSLPLAMGGPASRLLRLARAGWSAVSSPLGQLFGPTPLSAEDAVISGDVDLLSPSRIGMGESLAVGAAAGSDQTGQVGTTLPVNPTIQVLSGRRDHPLVSASEGLPVRIDVYFAVDSLDNLYAAVDSLDNIYYPVDSLDNVYSTTLRTDATGKVALSWTLGDSPGTYLLKATVPGAARTLLRAKATPPVSVSVAPTSASICVAKTEQFTATVRGTTETGVRWTSSDSRVATVNSEGQVTGVSAGTATITATSVADGTKSATATVTVHNECARIDSVTLSSSTLVIGGDNVTYSAVLSNATGEPIGDAAVQAWIEQGSARRAAGGANVSCGESDNTLPTGTCDFQFSIVAKNSLSGTGTLVPGEATALFELKSGSTILHTYSTTVTLVDPAPDLVVFSISDAPSTSEPGKHQITVRVRNEGSATAGASTVEIKVLNGTTEILGVRVAVPELVAGNESVVMTSFTPQAGVTYTARAVADVTSAVQESNENNNTQEHRFTPLPSE